jgi:hypothetical protein
MKFWSAVLLLLFVTSLHARSTLDYLPADTDPDPAVPVPESVLGWEVGDWHAGHDSLVQYLNVLAGASSRVAIEVIGHTHERRPLLLLAITAPENQAQLESLRQNHLDGPAGPLVVWLGYGVHGNEPSGSNAALLVAYYLAASRSMFVESLLRESIVLIDPSINPDGMNRFASWANSNAASVPVEDPVTRLHVQGWPTARTNHYWFDLNRDWLPLVHPSSRARIREYHRWLPHVLTDHHEQTRFPGFFFQPGVPTRQNPLTPAQNFELTRVLAAYHSAALDEAGQPYFSEDAYDDFYYGKGSTYPDINGSIGILFEQKAITGQALATSNGTETFRMAIANQLAMSLSTLRGSWDNRDRLKRYQAGFHDGMLERAQGRDYAGWIVGDDGDPERAKAFLETLALHQIEYQPMAGSIRAGGYRFDEGHAWILPARQRQFGLLEALMEQRMKFDDNTFYDVSAWTLPLAFNLPFAPLARLPQTAEEAPSSRGTAPDSDARAWAIPWNQLKAPVLLQEILDVGGRVRSAVKPFSAQTSTGMVAFQPGTLIIQSGIQEPGVLAASVDAMTRAALDGLDVFSLDSTLTAAGPDLGAIHFKLLAPVKPLIIGGKGLSAYDVGEIWHLLDQRLKLAAPISDMPDFHRVDLRNYSHLLMADGDYASLDAKESERIVRWVREGGVVVASGRASTWIEQLCFEKDPEPCESAPAVNGDAEAAAPRAYSDFKNDEAQQVVGGAIAASMIDLSHPLAFGIRRPQMPLLRRGTVELEPSKNAYSTPVRYTENPLLAGFIGPERLDAIRGQPAVIAEKKGRGLVVRFANTPLFRGYWRGTERLFVNALYLGQVIESTELPEFTQPPEPETPQH